MPEPDPPTSPSDDDVDPISGLHSRFRGYGPVSGETSGRHLPLTPGPKGLIAFRTVELNWTTDAAYPGIEVKVLRTGQRGNGARLFRLSPGVFLPPHRFPEGAEILVLEGYIEILEEVYPAGSYLYLPPGRRFTIGSPIGASGGTLFLAAPSAPEESGEQPMHSDEF